MKLVLPELPSALPKYARIAVYLSIMSRVWCFPFLITWSLAELIDLFHRVAIMPDANVDAKALGLYRTAAATLPLLGVVVVAAWAVFTRYTAYRHHLSQRREESHRALAGPWRPRPRCGCCHSICGTAAGELH